MFCFALRAVEFNEIMNDTPQFKVPMRRKVIGNYARNLYFPLMRMKRQVMDMFNMRNDF